MYTISVSHKALPLLGRNHICLHVLPDKEEKTWSDHNFCSSSTTAMDAPPAPEYGSTSTLVLNLSIFVLFYPLLYTTLCLNAHALRFPRAFARFSPLTSLSASTPPPPPCLPHTSRVLTWKNALANPDLRRDLHALIGELVFTSSYSSWPASSEDVDSMPYSLTQDWLDKVQEWMATAAAQASGVQQANFSSLFLSHKNTAQVHPQGTIVQLHGKGRNSAFQRTLDEERKKTIAVVTAVCKLFNGEKGPIGFVELNSKWTVVCCGCGKVPFAYRGKDKPDEYFYCSTRESLSREHKYSPDCIQLLLAPLKIMLEEAATRAIAGTLITRL